MISVIIPVYNRPDMVARSVAAAQAQKGIATEDLEIIVVDDGSVPALSLIDTDTRLKIIRLERNAGAAAARNAGIRTARGEYIAFLDSDDVWLAEKLERQLSALRRIEEDGGEKLCALVCGFYWPNDMTGALQARVPRATDRLTDFVSGCWFAPGSALLIRRSAFERIGMFDERLRRLEDLDWFIRFGLMGGELHVLKFIGAIIAPSNSADPKIVMESTAILEAKFGQFGDAKLPVREWKRLRAYIELERGAAYLSRKHRLRALRHILVSLWLKPRMRTAVEPFWDLSDDVPEEVLQTYNEIKRRTKPGTLPS